MWYIGKVKQSWKWCHEAFNNGAINKKRALIAKLEVAGCPFSALQCEIWEKRGLKLYKRASTYKREQYKLTIHIDSEILWPERTRCTTLVKTNKTSNRAQTCKRPIKHTPKRFPAICLIPNFIRLFSFLSECNKRRACHFLDGQPEWDALFSVQCGVTVYIDDLRIDDCGHIFCLDKLSYSLDIPSWLHGCREHPVPHISTRDSSKSFYNLHFIYDLIFNPRFLISDVFEVLSAPIHI